MALIHTEPIKLTDKQKEAVGQVMADSFGASFQTGRYAGHDEWVYVAWQFGPNWPVHFAYIDPEGTVVYDPANRIQER